MIPLRIEITNLGAIPYTNIELQNVTLAGVVGPNGTGKTTALTIAPLFALFGTTKNGCSVDDMVRKGTQEAAVTFEFEHRGETYRATRTRSTKGRGKSTLELQHMVSGQWVSESGTTVRETEDKIKVLLNLDAETFTASSMILQGRANEFTAKPPGQRKAILQQILGLEIYDRLLEAARMKERAASVELEKAKAKQTELDEKLKGRPALEAERDNVGAELKQVAKDIANKEAELRVTEETVRSLQANAEKAGELLKQIDALTIEITDKQTDLETQKKRLAEAEKYTYLEDKIKKNAAEYERINILVIALRAKKPQLDRLKTDVSRIESDISKVDAAVKKIDAEIADKEQSLQERPALEKAEKEYREAVASVESMDVLFEKWTGLDTKLRDARDIWNTGLTAYESKTKTLEKEIETLRNKAAMLADSNCIDSEKASCRFLADAIEAKAKLTEVQSEYNGHIIQACKITALTYKKSSLENERDALEYNSQEHRSLKSLVTKLRPKADKLAQLAGQTEVIENLKIQKQQEEGRKTESTAQLTAKKDELQMLEEELSPLADYEKRLPNLLTWVDALKKLPAEQEVKTATTERIAALEREITAKEERSGKLKQERHVLLVKTSGINNAKSNVVSYQGYIKIKQAEQNTLHAKQGGIKAKLDALELDEIERQRISVEIEPTAKSLVRWQTLIKAFGRDGIPALIIENAVPELERIANEILGQMSKGEHSLRFETQRDLKSRAGVAETLDIIVGDWTGERPYETFSGGEQLRIDFAIRFALAELLARRAGSKVEWLTVDEGLGSQDVEHRALVLEAIKAVADRFKKTLVITHIEEAQAVFDERIYFEPREDGVEVRVT